MNLSLRCDSAVLFCKAALAMFFIAMSLAASASSDCPELPAGNISGHVELAEGCTYSRSIRIVDSNTVLDCKGAIFVGGGTDKMGLLIDSRGKELRNVEVKSCTFRNFSSNGVRITWNAVDTEKGSNKAEIYRRSPSKILLDRLVIENSGRHGVYLDDYVSEVTLRNSIVRSSGGAVYLEHSSRRNKLLNNQFIGNGFRADGVKREAVSVDSSAENSIVGNLFQRNAGGGIFLYKNCGERFSSGKQALRWQHSDQNNISNNTFSDEEIGIWIASRQSKNLSKWDCGDSAMDTERLYFRDYADNNIVSGNTFCKTKIPIKNEGDDNRIIGNRFDRRNVVQIDMPLTMRQRVLNLPIRGTVQQDNLPIECGDRR